MSVLPPQEIPFRRRLIIILIAMVLSACGSIDYDIHSESFFATGSKHKDMATIHFHYSDTSDNYDMAVRKVRGGVALQAPMYTGRQGDHVNFVASGTMEKKYFMGVEGRLSF